MKYSVIVPTYNRLPYLKNALESLLRQDYNDMEIIIVDDGSNDGTSDYLDNMKNTKNIIVIHQKNRGPAAARNAGIQAAAGDIIGFTDDDCVVPSNWVRKSIDSFSEPDIAFIGGTVKNGLSSRFFSHFSQELTNYTVLFLGKDRRPTSFLTSNNIAYRADVLREIGGFDACFRLPGGEERALNYRILDSGKRGILIPDLTIEHYHAMDFKRFFRQQMNYGRGSFILFHVIAPKLKNPISHVSVRIYAGLAASWLKQNLFTGILKISLFILSQVQLIIGYFWESIAYSMRKDIN